MTQKINFILLTAILLIPLFLNAQDSTFSCDDDSAASMFREGYQHQQEGDPKAAIKAYRNCLKYASDCIECNYEIGWSYWSLSEWDLVIDAWQKTLVLDPAHSQAKLWLPLAKEKLAMLENKDLSSLYVPIGTISSPAKSELQLTLFARIQNYNSKPENENDKLDIEIFSPKSVRFTMDGKKAYVNSLEGFSTNVYDTRTLDRIKLIRHKFRSKDQALFQGMTTVFDYRFTHNSKWGNVNYFMGKPVESELTHNGKFLWVPYYRRDYDKGATSPSAVAVIDVESDSIVRVIPTGPIPKYIEASPDNRYLAIIHWGDNTAIILDISSNDPHQFKYLKKKFVVEYSLSQKGLAEEDRDKACGFCLRGAVFTPDSKILLIARMGGGGIAGFDMESQSYLGTVLGMKPTPRHLVISKDGKFLYTSSNISGYVSKIPLVDVVKKLKIANGKRKNLSGWQDRFVGIGARTIALSPDGLYLFAAVNSKSEVVALNAENMQIVCRVRTDSYTVGLAVSPDGKQLWTTSQGKDRKGGNSVCIFKIQHNGQAE